ncbi:MAG: alpha/beta hydrolase [Planctomycetota bacterium]
MSTLARTAMHELTLPIPLVMLPGLGADGQLFAEQRKAFGDDAIVVPDWLPPHEDEPLHLYAKRFAEQLGPSLPTKYALAGVSFGGMLAQEMLRHLEPKPASLLLVSSARTSDAVPTIGGLMATLGAASPLGAMKAFHTLASVPFAKLNDGDDQTVSIFMAMAKTCDPAFFKWSLQRVAAWEGPPPELEGLGVPVRSIHGRKDPVLRCISELTDTVVAEGKHLISLTHHKSVNRFLFEQVLAVCPEAQIDYPAIEGPDQTVARRAMLTG